MAEEFELRAVFTALKIGYVVSVSLLSDNGAIEVLGEDEVGNIEEAHQFVAEIADSHSYPIKKVDCLYNIHGKISSTPPKVRQ